ncbi:uncharacterized protein LOC116207360 [Punica granatum]|uniref:Uncharacterized protein LOC116207360 n=1 Tax=Punica granatum TaxID=22663 RepID=A0A6P8DP03_PUNGR|nr:uncharacterized protein LOC116207360 [Punica granatum]
MRGHGPRAVPPGKSAEGIATHELSTTTSREILGAVRRCAQPLVPSPPALASQAPLGSLLVLFPSSWVCFVQQQLPTSTSSLPHPSTAINTHSPSTTFLWHLQHWDRTRTHALTHMPFS